MKVVVAINAFKGCLSSLSAGRAARCGVVCAVADAVVPVLPVSDGGNGLLEAMSVASSLRMHRVAVHDPLMRPIRACYGVTPDGTMAVVESALASGLHLLARHERNPLYATSYGTGELIARALSTGCRRLVVGLGGSATSDAGMGLLRALGVRIDDGGVDDSALRGKCYNVEVTIACDVVNPLYGEGGAAAVYGPQKGADAAMVGRLDERARRFALLTARHIGHDYAGVAGAGAAGGMGFALMAYLRGRVQSGAEVVLDAAGFDDMLADADVVITGEGCADRQTLMGKLPQRVLQRAQRHGVPTVLIAGRVEHADELTAAGFAEVRCIHAADLPLAACMQPATAERNIALTVKQIIERYIHSS